VTGLVWAALGVAGCLAMTALGDMVSEEARDRLDHLPHAILRLAAQRLDPAQRLTVYQDEWLPELAYILKGDQARPITRLINGTSYAVGILAKTNCITPHLHRPVPEQPRPLGLKSSAPMHAVAQEAPQASSPILAQYTPKDGHGNFCTECGREMRPEGRFCVGCGAELRGG